MSCNICDSELRYAWTDHHGIAQCVKCGAPYRLLHYEGEGDQKRRVEKPPEPLLTEDAEPARRCWEETRAKLSAVGMGFSFPGGYDVATGDDYERSGVWWKQYRAAGEGET
jgi:hypothetical protein